MAGARTGKAPQHRRFSPVRECRRGVGGGGIAVLRTSRIRCTIALQPLGPCPSRPELKCNFHLQGASMMKRATFNAPLCATTLLALVAVSFGEALAQSAVITGKVTGRQGEALGGAIVVIDEFSTAVATTTQGTYTLTVAPERTKGQTVTLRARYIGYSPGVKQVTLTPGTQTQDFELKFDPMTLDAVVVTGVAEATEAKKLTFAVGHVDAQTLNQAPGVSALGALEGKVAGARLIMPSGAPGGEPTIRLRAATAITSPSACADTRPGATLCPSSETSGPLIIVDGTITHHGLADVNSEDIERVEDVKGAAASSLYGSNVANGLADIFTH